MAARMMMALQAHHRGGPEELIFERVSVPTIGAGEVLVEVHAAAITFTELHWDETWTTRDGRDRTPVVPSHEFSGVVSSIGSHVADWRPGDEVFGLIDFNRNGAAAEFVGVPSTSLARRPTAASHVESAAVPLAALTAWQALVDHAQTEAGDEVLVLGGAGGVGSYGVQLAHHLKAQVTATALSTDRALLLSLGADHVVDYEHESIPVRESGYDVVFDAVGGSTAEESFGLLRPGGHLVTLSTPPDQDLARNSGVNATYFVVSSDTAELNELAQLVDDGILQPVIAQTFPLSEGRRAFETGKHVHRPGKTVLVVR